MKYDWIIISAVVAIPLILMASIVVPIEIENAEAQAGGEQIFYTIEYIIYVHNAQSRHINDIDTEVKRDRGEFNIVNERQPKMIRNNDVTVLNGEIIFADRTQAGLFISRINSFIDESKVIYSEIRISESTRSDPDRNIVHFIKGDFANLVDLDYY